MSNLQQRLNRLLAYWTKELRLQDWDLEAVMQAEAWPDSGDVARICYNMGRKAGQISIVHPAARPPDEDKDIEEDLVHELLHLHFATVEARAILVPADLDLAIEQPVNILAAALVRLRRQTKNNKMKRLLLT